MGVGSHPVHHLSQGLLGGQSLTQLADLALRRGPHEELDFQCPGHHRLQLGQPPVFPQVFQGFQHKQSLHLGNELLHFPHNMLEGHTGGGKLPDFQCYQHLSGGGGTGIEDVDVDLRVVLLQQNPGLLRTVM